VKEKDLQQVASQVDQSEKNFIKDNPSKDLSKSTVSSDEKSQVYAPPLVAGSYDMRGNVVQQNVKISEDLNEDNKENEHKNANELSDTIQSSENPELIVKDELTEQSNALQPKNGEYEYIHEDGKHSFLTYKNGELSGPTRIFNKSGDLEFEGVMENGKLNGVCKIYDNGILKSETMMLDDIPNGKSRQFDENGILTTEIMFKNGKKHGEMVQFHSNGEISSITTFANDKMNGPCEHRNVDGKVSIESAYANDKLHGLMKNFYTGVYGNGIMRESNYDNGLLAGKEILYHSSGYISSESYYENGQLTAPTKTYPPPKKMK
jgi:antitoxin component YwqK of YwqJK toxin-antitoxin module